MVLITLQLLCSLLFITSAVAQRTNFPVLPRPNDYSDGKFLVPNTAQNQVYPNGIQLNVTWQTTFPQINLFFIIDNNFAQPVQLLSGLTVTSYLWTVNDYGNNTGVFSFRITNSRGSDSDQLGGGFYTGNFYISDPALVSPTTSVVRTTATTTSRTSTDATTATTTSTATTAPISTATSAGATTTSSSSPAGITAIPTSEATPPPPSSNIGVAVGAGVGAGVVIIGLIAALIFCFLRRRKRQSDAPANPQNITHGDPGAAQLPAYAGHETYYATAPKEASMAGQVYEVPAEREISEVAAHSYYKPGQGISAQSPLELPDNSFVAFNPNRSVSASPSNMTPYRTPSNGRG